jgi:hypothetical protein
MKKDKKDLVEALMRAISEYNADSVIVNKITEELSKVMSMGKANDIFNGQIALDTLKKYELYFLTDAIYVNTTDGHVRPSTFFTEIEINKYNETVDILKPIETSEDNELIIENVGETIKDKYWSCDKETYKKIASFFQRGLIYYDVRMQRETDKKIILGRLIEKPKIYGNNLNKIKSLMEQHLFSPNAITLNIMDNELGSDFEYNEKTRTLTIKKTASTSIAIIDGFHRALAILSIMEEDPDFDEVMKINILHYTVKEAQQYINQENSGMKINEDVTKVYDITDSLMIMARQISEYESINTNLLFNNLGKDLGEVKLKNKYTTLKIFSDAIRDNFNIDMHNFKETRKIRTFIIDFFNELLSNFSDETKNIRNNRKNSAKLQPYSFAGYVALASKLYSIDRWEDKLEIILLNESWDLNNEIWDKLRISNDKLTKPALRKIYKYFEEMLDKNLVLEEVK